MSIQSKSSSRACMYRSVILGSVGGRRARLKGSSNLLLFGILRDNRWSTCDSLIFADSLAVGVQTPIWNQPLANTYSTQSGVGGKGGRVLLGASIDNHRRASMRFKVVTGIRILFCDRMSVGIVASPEDGVRNILEQCARGMQWLAEQLCLCGWIVLNDDEMQPSLFALAALLNCFLPQSYSFFGTPMRMHIATATMTSLISELCTPFRARKALPWWNTLISKGLTRTVDTMVWTNRVLSGLSRKQCKILNLHTLTSGTTGSY